MGGLVMRSLLALRPADYSRLVRKWIAIASPFGGAPGFGLDALMTGVEFCQVLPAPRPTLHACTCRATWPTQLQPTARIARGKRRALRSGNPEVYDGDRACT